MGTLQSYITARQKDGIKTRTINHGLQVIRHILNLASGEWMDEFGLTWLAISPKIKLLPEHDLRKTLSNGLGRTRSAICSITRIST